MKVAKNQAARRMANALLRAMRSGEFDGRPLPPQAEQILVHACLHSSLAPDAKRKITGYWRSHGTKEMVEREKHPTVRDAMARLLR